MELKSKYDAKLLNSRNYKALASSCYNNGHGNRRNSIACKLGFLKCVCTFAKQFFKLCALSSCFLCDELISHVTLSQLFVFNCSSCLFFHKSVCASSLIVVTCKMMRNALPSIFYW